MVIHKATIETIIVLTNEKDSSKNLAKKTPQKVVTFLQSELMLLFQKISKKILARLFILITTKKIIVLLFY